MFYKIDQDHLLEAPNVEGPGYSLTEVSRGEYFYPVDGWYWFENKQKVLDSIPGISEEIVKVLEIEMRSGSF